MPSNSRSPEPSSAGQRHSASVRGLTGSIKRGFDAVGDEREGRSALELKCLAGVMSQHEYRVMERRIVPPPAVPRLAGLPRTGVAAKHVPPHQRGPDVGDRLFDHPVARVDLSAFLAHRLPPCREWKDPLVQPHAADPERVVHALAGTGDEAVEGHRDLEAQSGHAHFLDQNPIGTPPGTETIAIHPMPPGSWSGGNISVAPAASAFAYVA